MNATKTLPAPIADSRVLVLVDGSNAYHQVRDVGAALELDGFHPWASAYGKPEIHWFQGAHACSTSFLHEVRRRTWITLHEIRPHEPAPGVTKADADTTLVATGVERMIEGDFSTIILVGGDSDYLPLLANARKRNLRIVIVADRAARHHGLDDYVEQPTDLLELSNQRCLLRDTYQTWIAA